jgi:hypothetical protein
MVRRFGPSMLTATPSLWHLRSLILDRRLLRKVYFKIEINQALSSRCSSIRKIQGNRPTANREEKRRRLYDRRCSGGGRQVVDGARRRESGGEVFRNSRLLENWLTVRPTEAQC